MIWRRYTRWAERHTGAPKWEEHRVDGTAIKERVIGLIAVGEQAAVACAATILRLIWPLHAALRVQVADIERGDRHAGQGVRVVDQTGQDPGAALGRLPEQQAPLRPCANAL